MFVKPVHDCKCSCHQRFKVLTIGNGRYALATDQMIAPEQADRIIDWREKGLSMWQVADLLNGEYTAVVVFDPAKPKVRRWWWPW